MSGSRLAYPPGGTSGGSVPNICVKANRTTTQSINSATSTAIAFNAADSYDTDSMHDTVTNNTRITFNTAGVYHITGFGVYDASISGVRYLSHFINGSTQIEYTSTLGTSLGGIALIVSSDYKATVGDYVELVAYQDSGVAVDIINATFSAVKVAAG